MSGPSLSGWHRAAGDHTRAFLHTASHSFLDNNLAFSSQHESAVDSRGRPIGDAAAEPIFGCFAVVIDGGGLPGEHGPVIEAIGVDDGAGTGRGLADGANIHAAAPANQELGGARAEAVGFDEQPVLGPDLDRPVRIAGRARVVGAAERTAAGAQPRFLGRPGQTQAQAEIAAMTAAAVFRQWLPPDGPHQLWVMTTLPKWARLSK
jgi:hypothetical protein